MVRRVLRPSVETGPAVSSAAALRPGFVVLAIVMLAIAVPVIGLFVTDGGFTGPALGTTLGLLVLVGSALFVGLLVLPRRGRLEVATDEGRLWLPAARPVGPLALIAMVLAVLLGVVVVIGFVVDGGFRASNLASVGAVLVAGLTLPTLIGAVRGALVAPRVGLGPDDIVRESGRSVVSAPWKDVLKVELVTDPAPRVLITSVAPIRTERRSPVPVGELPVGGPRTGAQQLAIPTNMHASDARLVELVIRHYAKRDRAELGTPAAEDRIARGDLFA